MKESNESATATLIHNVLIVAALAGVSVALALAGHETLAATALGGAVGAALPSRPQRVPPPVLGLAFALSAGALLGGCGALGGAPPVKVACDAARAVCAAASATCGAIEPATSGGSEAE